MAQPATTMSARSVPMHGRPLRCPKSISAIIVEMRRMSPIGTMIAEMDFGERSSVPCIGAERADLVVAGCAILEAILDIWPADRLGVADRGIREGILRSLMANDGHLV